MERAVAEYNTYRECPDAWMLSHFICPVAKLSEFEEAFSGLVGESGPYPVSALGRIIEGPDSFLQYVQEDVMSTKQFVERNAGKVNVDAFEFCLPPGVATQPERLEKDLAAVCNTITQHATSSHITTVYYEVPSSMSRQDDIAPVVRAIARQNSLPKTQSTSDKSSIVGFKIRCGGVKAEQFPSVEHVVHCIKTCINEGVRLKLTAGLHHPFRHFNESVQTKMHGFINIFTATLLGMWHKLDETTLTRIIEDEDHTNFQTKEQSLSWKDLSITNDQITEGRSNTIISFGCCNFDEPREDMQKSGLL